MSESSILSTEYRQQRAERLPQELVDLIIDHLHDDYKQLKFCSLVCKSWVPSSRYHLFARLSLESGHDFRKWSQRFLPSTTEPAVFVQTISVRSPAADLSGFMEHFRSFPRVRQLQINWVDLDVFRKKTNVCFCHFAATLKSLCLSWPVAAVPADFLQFMCVFPYLDDLSIEGLHIGTHDVVQCSPKDVYPRFGGSLSLEKCEDPGQIIGHLAAFHNGLSFRQMSLKDSKFTDPAYMGAVFPACASTLEKLTIANPSFSTRARLSSATLSLENNIVLQHLILETSEEKAYWLKDIIASIKSPVFTRMTLKIIPSLLEREEAEEEDELVGDGDDWEKVDHALIALCKDRPTLKVLVELGPGWDKSCALHLISELLPELAKKGVMHVVI